MGFSFDWKLKINLKQAIGLVVCSTLQNLEPIAARMICSELATLRLTVFGAAIDGLKRKETSGACHAPGALPGWRGATIQGLIFGASVKIYYQTTGTWKVGSIILIRIQIEKHFFKSPITKTKTKIAIFFLQFILIRF